MGRKRRSMRRQSRSRNVVSRGIRPPQLKTYPDLTHTYRFFANSTVSNSIITSDLLFGAAGGICTVANSLVTCLFGTLKVKRVQIWAPLLSSGTNEIEVLWGIQGTPFSNPVRVSDVSVSTAYPAHIDTRPPTSSIANFWQNVSVNEALFKISCPTSSYIDVTLQLTLWNNEGAGFSTNVALGSLGDMYYMSLDGPTPHDMQPIGLNTTN
jgi:hypothetical protein